jgi:putative inorganic carbon (hco3(-)) transporter
MITIILSLGLILFAWLTVKKPHAALGLVLALPPTYLVRFKIINFPTTLLELALVVFLIVVFTIHYKNMPAVLRGLSKFNIAIGLFILAGLISIAVSPEQVRALGLFKAFILEPVLFFYAVKLITAKPEDFIVPLKWLFGITTLISFFGIFQYWTGLFLPLRFWGNGEEVRRISSFFEYPNALALYLAPLFVLFLVLRFKKFGPFTSRIYIAGLIIQALAVLLTFSRGAWLAIGLTLLLVLLIQYPIKKIALGLIAIILIFSVVPPLRGRVIQTFNDPSGFARVDLGKAAITKLKQSPILGNGLYGFRTTLEEQSFKGEVLNYPHNIVLNFWIEMGLLGLLSFVFIIYWSLKKYKQNPTVINLAACAFIAVIVIHGIVDVPYFKNDLALLFWFALSMIHLQKII